MPRVIQQVIQPGPEQHPRNADVSPIQKAVGKYVLNTYYMPGIDVSDGIQQ